MGSGSACTRGAETLPRSDGEAASISSRLTPGETRICAIGGSAMAIGGSAVAIGGSAMAIGGSAMAIGGSAVAIGGGGVVAPWP